MRSIVYFVFFGMLLSFSACKKTEKPEDQVAEQELRLNKVSLKQTRNGVADPGKNVYSFSYDASGKITKVLLNVVDLPASVGAWDNGAFDSYEYNSQGQLAKVSVNRFNSGINGIQEIEYDEYSYDGQGQLSKVTVYTKKQGPNGAVIFRPTAYISYRYAQQQLVEQKQYFSYSYDANDKEIYTLREINRYEYGASGNLSKHSSFSATSGIEVLERENKYNSFDSKQNPFYDKTLPGNGLIQFSINKNNPAAIEITGFTNISGLANTVSGRTFIYAYNGNYPNSIKEQYIDKFYVAGAPNTAPTLNTVQGNRDWEFEYIDKP